MSIEFLTNDDLIMQMIANGAVSGTPDGHLIYSGVFWGYPLSLLYKITGAVDWYSLAQLVWLILGSCVVIYKVSKKAEKTYAKVVTAVAFAIIWCLTLFRCFTQLQFTVTAAFVGAIAIFYAITIDIEEDKRKWIRDCIIVSIFVLVSYNIRNMALLMLVPFAGAGWFGRWIRAGFKDKKTNLRFISLGVCIIVTLLVSEVCNRAYYSGYDWDKYLSFNKQTENVFDYSGFSDYEQFKETYEAIGMSKTDYEAIAYYDLQLLMEDINEDSLKTIYEMNPKGSIPTLQVIKNFIGRNLGYTDRPINLVVYLLWITAAVIAVTQLIKDRKSNILIDLALLFAARMALWFYLIYEGRLPDRITWSLYIAELLILIGLLTNIKFNKVNSIILIVGAICIAFISVRVSLPKAIKINEDNAARNYYGTSFEQLLDYASENSDKLFFLDANSLANVSRLKREHKGVGIAFLGGWLPGAPVEAEGMRYYGISDVQDHKSVLNNKNVLYVFKDSDITTEEYLVDFYSQYASVKSEEVDYISTDCGINFRVVRIYEDKYIMV